MRMICTRCGRNNHIFRSCFATTHKDGHKLPYETSARFLRDHVLQDTIKFGVPKKEYLKKVRDPGTTWIDPNGTTRRTMWFNGRKYIKAGKKGNYRWILDSL